MHNTAPHEPRPDPVCYHPCEPGVFCIYQPVGEGRPRVVAWPDHDSGTIREGRFGWIPHGRIVQHNLLFPLVRGFELHPGEEGCQVLSPVLWPSGNARAHECQGYDFGQTGRLTVLHRAVEVDWRYAEVAAARGEEVANEPVVRHVSTDGSLDPPMVGLHRVGPQVDRELRFHPQQVAPFQGPVLRELIACQELVYQAGTFVRLIAREECLHFPGFGQGSYHVQVYATKEDLVGRWACRLDAFATKYLQYQRIHTIRRYWPRIPFKWPDRGRLGTLHGHGEEDDQQVDSHAVPPTPRSVT